MLRFLTPRFAALLGGTLLVVVFIGLFLNHLRGPVPHLLTEPFLQRPTANAVQVVWFTEFAGSSHRVEYGANFSQVAEATTVQLSRMREDAKSRVGSQTEDGQLYSKPVMRNIWRHEAEVSGLTPGVRLPYRVFSMNEKGLGIRSAGYNLAALPRPDRGLKILLTSDHQLMPMTPANLQKVEETVGTVDAIFMAGDLVNIPDRASEWFDDNRGRAFFPALQGRARAELETENGRKVVYRGGHLIQSAPLFVAIANHEVMGRFSMDTDLDAQFNDPVPRAIAQQRYLQNAAEVNPTGDGAIATEWIKNQSFNIDSYSELFSMPQNPNGHSRYYAVTFGDVRLVVLYATNIWRTPSLNANARGRYRESDGDLTNPEKWGYGQHIFEAIAPGSEQYTWLQSELSSPEFTQAKYKVVMFHHPVHSLGDNIVPAYTEPVKFVDTFADGSIKAIRYEYPKGEDYLIRDVLPLLESAGTNLVLYGHSHLWNRFVSANGVNYLETSNVGNTYGAYLGDRRRAIPIGFQEDYTAIGDPNGLQPVMPTIAPVQDEAGNPQPYVASNEKTVFTLFDTGTGLVSSYYFDTRQPDSSVVKFDEFSLSSPSG